MKRRSLLIGAVTVAFACVVPVVSAFGDAVPGATYTGLSTTGASVEFTVSSDGTIVDSYKLTNVRGQEPNNGYCIYGAQGARGFWEGAPVVNNAFSYALGDRIQFQGQFDGPQSASGTFRLYDPPLGSAPACDTGTVSWTAKTTATPPASTGSGSGSGGGTGTGGGDHSKPVLATRIALQRLPKARLGGRISTARLCRANRVVVLWNGPHRVGSTRTNARGAYSFTRTRGLRGSHVRAGVKATTRPKAVCGAGTSKFISA